MILTLVQGPTETAPTLYQIPGDWSAYLDATFSPDAQHFGAVNTSLSRHKDRAGLHWEARGKLLELEELANVPGISWGELATIQEAARKIARRAGITREARREGCSLV